MIRGSGHLSNPIETRDVENTRISSLDLLQKFRRYEVNQLNKKSPPAEGSGIYQFADAVDDEKLIQFCQKFGPVWGKVRSLNREDDGTYTLTVVQSMKQLRHEQKKFAAATKLLQQLDRNGKADRLEMMKAMHDLLDIDPSVLGTVYFSTEIIPLGKSNREKIADFVPYAQIALCGVLNDFPLKLFPVRGGAIYLPDVRSEGIRNAIYYQFHLDYRAEREIGTCLHCGHHFPVYRRGTRGCSESCRRALRNRNYWTEKGESINRSRRESRKSEDQ